MRPLALSLALAASANAGQIEAPVTGQSRTGTQTGAIGTTLAAPAPLQLSVPSLSASDPLRAYYDGILADLIRRARI